MGAWVFVQNAARGGGAEPVAGGGLAPVGDAAARSLVETIGQWYPRHLLAWQLAAERLELAARPEALQVRRGLFEQDRASLTAQVGLATSALRARDFGTAEIALAAVDPRDHLRPDYLIPAAAHALATRRRAEADALLASLEIEDARRGQPFYRSCVALLQNNAERAEQARRVLAKMAAQEAGSLRLQARRVLVEDAGARGDLLVALEHARALTSDSEATLRDHLVRLTLESQREQPGPEATSYATTVGRMAAAEAGSASVYGTWLGVQGRAAEAREWIRGLPSELAATPAVRSALADTLLVLQDWDGLAALLAGGAWGPADPGPVRLAFSARVVRDQRSKDLRQQVWANALEGAGDNQATLGVLFRLAQAWGWPDESRDTLAALVRANPSEVWAFRALAVASARGPTSRLAEIYAHWSANHPEDVEVVARSILLELLTNVSVPKPGLIQRVRAFYEQEPLDPRRAVPYAFALYRTGATREALAALERCRPSQLREPGRALYYGLALMAEGYPAAAERAFAFAAPSELLPEEQALLRDGLESVR